MDDSQSDPHPEAGLFHSQTTQKSGPEVVPDIFYVICLAYVEISQEGKYSLLRQHFNSNSKSLSQTLTKVIDRESIQNLLLSNNISGTSSLNWVCITYVVDTQRLLYSLARTQIGLYSF